MDLQSYYPDPVNKFFQKKYADPDPVNTDVVSESGFSPLVNLIFIYFRFWKEYPRLAVRDLTWLWTHYARYFCRGVSYVYNIFMIN